MPQTNQRNDNHTSRPSSSQTPVTTQQLINSVVDQQISTTHLQQTARASNTRNRNQNQVTNQNNPTMMARRSETFNYSNSRSAGANANTLRRPSTTQHNPMMSENQQRLIRQQGQNGRRQQPQLTNTTATLGQRVGQPILTDIEDM
jgi:hypothetical protein